MKKLEIKYLSDDWYDMDYVLFHACFQTLVNYIENEDPFEVIDWDWDERYQLIKKEMQDLYKWYNDQWDGEKWEIYLSDKQIDEDPFMDEKIMDEMLQRLIEIKRYMWT